MKEVGCGSVGSDPSERVEGRNVENEKEGCKFGRLCPGKGAVNGK